MNCISVFGVEEPHETVLLVSCTQVMFPPGGMKIKIKKIFLRQHLPCLGELLVQNGVYVGTRPLTCSVDRQDCAVHR